VARIEDLSGKYGVGYLLANGSVGMIFNDGTSLTKRPENNFIYYDRKSTIYTELSNSLKKKGEILKLAQRKLI
jgi:hypothetical protein